MSPSKRPKGKESLSLIVHCRPLRGGESVGITVSINWSEPFALKPVMESYALPDGTPIRVPVMNPREHAAEKVRTKPAWAEIDNALTRFKSVTPHRAHP